MVADSIENVPVRRSGGGGLFRFESFVRIRIHSNLSVRENEAACKRYEMEGRTRYKVGPCYNIF